LRDPISKNPSQKELLEWLKVKALSSSPGTEKKKKRKEKSEQATVTKFYKDNAKQNPTKTVCFKSLTWLAAKYSNPWEMGLTVKAPEGSELQ
jgi:hypothetical protein